MNTAMMARDLGVSTGTVFRYVDRGILHALVRDPAILVAGEEFERFKREEWPLLPKGRGRLRNGQTIASIMRAWRLQRAARRSR